MLKIKHFKKTSSIKEIKEALKSDGALVVDNILSNEFVKKLREETDPYMESTPNPEDGFTGRLTTRTGGLVLRSEKCRDLIQNKVILSLCDKFLLDYCERYQLHLTQIIRLKPGQKAQPIHRDRWAWGPHLSHVEPQLNTIWALTDFTKTNGATRVAVGSPKWDDKRVVNESEIIQAEMSLGSVFLYSGSVFHGGGANESNEDRIGLNITYTLGWLRQEENQYLSTPPELAKDLEPKLQQLIGYSMGQYALGYYTPPGKPGEHPEIRTPEYALGKIKGTSSSMTTEDIKKADPKTHIEK